MAATHTRMMAAGAIVNLLEWYDFAASIGGALFGHIGDRLGRRAALRRTTCPTPTSAPSSLPCAPATNFWTSTAPSPSTSKSPKPCAGERTVHAPPAITTPP